MLALGIKPLTFGSQVQCFPLRHKGLPNYLHHLSAVRNCLGYEKSRVESVSVV